MALIGKDISRFEESLLAKPVARTEPKVVFTEDVETGKTVVFSSSSNKSSCGGRTEKRTIKIASTEILDEIRRRRKRRRENWTNLTKTKTWKW